MTNENKTHYRKAFDSPYLSSADIIEPTVLTIQRVVLQADQSNKTQDEFNTAYFAEKEIRQGEVLKPMILNAGNSRVMKDLCGSPFIDDWKDIAVTIYVDSNVKFGRDTVEGLRISTRLPTTIKPELKPDTKAWYNAIAAFNRDGNLDAVLARMTISDPNQEAIMKQASGVKEFADVL